ncbi:hypothetical protein H312_02821 [Anncaliia algerae PRA339]|uniref:Uncharacterized protein n=1 Tax=Anncaliia algerae PRA339 TaxID=1288291 RepID=A0A059EYG4_9MICR|nr:hypothetical protein H312_02821 [Anncaliia algerae PRA339]
MEIVEVKNRKEEIFYILNELQGTNQQVLILTNTYLPFTGLSSLRNTKNNLYIKLLSQFSLKVIQEEVKYYQMILICNLLLNNFEIVFLKKFLSNKNKRIILFIKTEDDYSIHDFNKIIKEFIK